MPIIDVQAKRRYAQQKAIIDRYEGRVSCEVRGVTVTNAMTRDEMERELRDLENQWED